MMSSEEESDSHGSFGDKLSKKQKRARQRVDAGEPRNSYSSIPNFTSRPGFMSGGIYGAIFPQGRQQFGFFGPGYAPAKMLNELLARPPKQEADEEGARAELSHDALRDFLQGHKKELQQLERELRHASPDNNNSLANNNNDEPKERREDIDADRERLADPAERADLVDERDLGLDADSRSLPSPPSVERLVTPKLEPDADPDRERASPTPSRPDKMPLEVKRARVENIVSTMRSSPVPPALPQVNGCKKRKLYHPQQHGTEAERYLARAHSLSIDSSEDDSERPPIQQKLVEKNALKSQLRSMQEQLAEMQQKYVQLCNRMEHESETVDNDDAASSDVEQLDEATKPSPASSPKKIDSPPPVSGAPNVLSQVMSKMMSANRHPPHAPALQPGFNGSIPMMPHLAPGPEPHQLHHAPPHPHHNLNSAAAMYLNVSQKLFMEQEAMRAKDHAEQQNFAAQQQHHQQRTQSSQHSPNARPPIGPTPKPPTISSELVERLDALRSNANSVGPVSGADLERLAEVLKSEITASLTSLVDSIVTRFVHERRFAGKQSEAAAAAAERLNKDLMLASRLLGAERKSPGTKERAGGPPGHMTGMFQPPKPPPGLNPALYGAMNGQPFCVEREPNPEQNEALSLVVTPKKKRHKVTDTRITPRTVSRILGEGMGPSPAPASAPESPSPRPYPPGMSLPTSVAIPNPSLHESQVFSPYSPFFGAGGMGGMGGMGGIGGMGMRAGVGHSPPAPLERDSPPLPHAPALLHPALLAAAHRASTTPDYLRHHHLDQQDPHSDCNSTDIPYDGIQPTSSTLTPMHLRKAKLMFFWVRYPSSAVLKMYFPDIKFNKNNTAQLVKWFSNFREFYYIQMEKYARQAISEGQKSADELHVAGDSEIYRVLNLHYNRNNHIEVPSNFRYVVEQTLREFFRAIQGGKDTEQSWKKSIYKIISRLDDPVPEYFKSPNFLEQLE